MFDRFNGGVGPDCGSDRKLNLVQLLALSWMIGACAGASMRIAGGSWGAALLTAWAGATLGALGVTAMIVLAEALWSRGGRRAGVPDGIDALVGAWDADLSLDRAQMADAGAEVAANGAAGGRG